MSPAEMPWRRDTPIPWRTIARVIVALVVLLVLVQGVNVIVALRSPTRRARTLKGRAELLRQAGQLDEAAQALEAVLAVTPDDTAVILQLSDVRRAQAR